MIAQCRRSQCHLQRRNVQILTIGIREPALRQVFGSTARYCKPECFVDRLQFCLRDGLIRRVL